MASHGKHIAENARVTYQSKQRQAVEAIRLTMEDIRFCGRINTYVSAAYLPTFVHSSLGRLLYTLGRLQASPSMHSTPSPKDAPLGGANAAFGPTTWPSTLSSLHQLTHFTPTDTTATTYVPLSTTTSVSSVYAFTCFPTTTD